MLPLTPSNTQVLDESDAKSALSAFGLKVPLSKTASSPENVVAQLAGLTAPWVLKGMGLAHKSEAGAVNVGLRSEAAVLNAANDMNYDTYLIEEMIENTIEEILLSVTLDPAHGYLLTLGAGGTQTELLQDTVSLILPVTQDDVTNALPELRCAPLFDGFRGGER